MATTGPDQLWIVRHGETEWSRDGRHTSTTDIDLTPGGEEVARGLAGRLADADADADIDLILTMKREAGGTVHDMPDPVMLHLRDTDSAGANTALVNLFDYSGEMMTESLDVGLLRRRAVLMDGFLLFFDPTQMYGDTQDGEATLSIED